MEEENVNEELQDMYNSLSEVRRKRKTFSLCGSVEGRYLFSLFSLQVIQLTEELLKDARDASSTHAGVC